MRQLINSTQISTWFNSVSRDAQELLPHLIRKLIAAAVAPESLRGFTLPVGDDIRRHGFDGVVESVISHPFVPTGTSVWEFGVGDPAGKFDVDYRNRTTDPRGAVLRDTQFVFVTPHPWAGKVAVAAEKTGEALWKSVRIFDNADLEAWIELSPAVGRWLAQQMGVPIEGLDTLDTFHRVIESSYRTNLSSQLVIAGRQAEAEQLRAWLGGEEPAITLKAETMQEGAAFVSATVQSTADGQRRDRFLSTIVVVESVSAVEYLSANNTALIIVPTTLEASRRARAIASKRFRLVDIVIRRSLDRGFSDPAIRLGPVRREAVEQALKDQGVPEIRATRIAAECKGSLTATFMMLGSPDDSLPWMRGETAYRLAPLVLIGQWDSTNERDWAVVERLSGRAIDEIEPLVAEWSGPSGPLIRRGTVIDWIAWDFAWRELATHFTDQLLKRLVEVTTEALGTPDPQLELEPDKRFMASIYGKVHPYSSQLRRGLIDTLILFGMNVGEGPGVRGPSLADRVVGTLLNPPISESPTRWLSLAWALDDLAEASPHEFLSAVERLISDDDARKAMFKEERGSGFPSSHHTHLLWALERLAWCAKYLSRAIILLGRLAASDPGGQLGNRPGGSLREILLPWKPGTNASVDERMKAIDALRGVEPEQAWKLGKSLLPKDHDLATPTNKPKWRDWGDRQPAPVPFSDYFASIEQITRRLVAWTSGNPAMWAELVGEISPLWHAHNDLATEVFQTLSELKIEAWPTEMRAHLANVLRPLIARHKRFADADWALPASVIETLSQLLKRALPDDLILNRAYLFAHHVEAEGLDEGDWQRREEQLSGLRMDVVKAVFDSGHISGVERLGEAVEQAQLVGASLAQALGSDELDAWAVVAFQQSIEMARAPVKLDELVKSYLVYRYWLNGTVNWLSSLRTRFEGAWSDDFAAALCSQFPAHAELWDLLDSWGQDVSARYWATAPLSSVQNSNGQLGRAASKLLEAQRPIQAIHLLGMHSYRSAGEGVDPLPAGVVEAALRSALESRKDEEVPKPDVSNLSHKVASLLDFLESEGSDPQTLVQLEWGWLSALKYTRRGIKALRTSVCADPQFFVELLTFAFHGKDEPPRDLTDHERRVGRQAADLLMEVNSCPGLVAATPTSGGEGDVTFVGGDVDETKLREWVNTARRFAAEVDRLGICDCYIGKFLAFSPSFRGIWPCEVVCRLLESLASEAVEGGLITGVHNKRGIHFVEPEGRQEKRLEGKFRNYAETLRHSYFRTAAVLDQIADSYKSEAQGAIEREHFEEFDR